MQTQCRLTKFEKRVTTGFHRLEPFCFTKTNPKDPNVRRFNWDRCHHGLTLIEMVVVLAILAVLAGVAVQSLEPIADQARYEATQKTMESVKNAIVEDRLQTSGARHVTGFVADIGQLPTSTWMLIDSTGNAPFFVGNGSSSTAGSTSLVSDPGNSTHLPRDYTIGNAMLTAGNGIGSQNSQFQLAMHLQAGLTAIPLGSYDSRVRRGPSESVPPINPTTVDCTDVSLHCGWRGPYLTVTDPAKGVVDGWGREFGIRDFPNADDDVHLVWTAPSDQYTDQVINLDRLANQTVLGRVLDSSGAPKVAKVVLVYPDLRLSLDDLAVKADLADANGENSNTIDNPEANDRDDRFRFDDVPAGIRALVFQGLDPNTGDPLLDPVTNQPLQAIRYIEVTPMQQANLMITITEF